LPPDEARKKLRLASRCKGRSSFKDGFSPELIILKDYLLVIQTLMLTKPYLRQLKAKLYVKKLLSNSMVRFPTSNILTMLGPFHPSTLTTLHSSSMSKTLLRRFAEEVKSMLHGRHRQRYRRQMNVRIRAMQDQLELKEVSKVIRKLTDKPFQRVDLSFFRDNAGNFLESPRKIHAALVHHFSEWHSSPALMDKTAESLHFDLSYVDSLMAPASPALLHKDSKIPADLQSRIIASLRRPLPFGVSDEMMAAIQTPVSLQAFMAAIKGQPSGKAPGPSGLTANMIKSWPDSIINLAHSIIQTLWSRGEVPGWWGDRLLCLASKSSAEFSLDNLRPISLFEVIRKIWLGIIS
jgi:hypothetical protein